MSNYGIPTLGVSASGIAPSIPKLDPDSNDPRDEILPSGVYLATIKAFYPNTKFQQMMATIDIAVGPYEDYFSGLAPALDWTHAVKLSYKPGGLPYTKRALACIAAVNDGFEPFGAWNDGDYGDFAGKLAFVLATQRERANQYGEVEVRYGFKVMDPIALQAGTYYIPGRQHPDGSFDDSVQGEPVDVDAMIAKARVESHD